MLGAGNATLTVSERSHIYGRDVYDRFKHVCTNDKKDRSIALEWKLDQRIQDYLLNEKDCVYRDITCPAGSVALWDSRAAHSGRGPIKIDSGQSSGVSHIYPLYTEI